MSEELVEKMVYEFKVPAGGTIIEGGVPRTLEREEKYAVWGKPGQKSGVDRQMSDVAPGQIVALVYESDLPSAKFPKNPTHVIQLYQDKNVIDKEWLETHEIEKDFNGEEVPDDNEEEPHYEPVATQAPTKELPFTTPTEELLVEIKKIATTKLGAKTDEEVKDKVMVATKLAFLEVNYKPILELLKTL